MQYLKWVLPVILSVSFSPMLFAAVPTDILQHSWEAEQLCPSKLVNFWTSYARKNNDLGSIPAFLINNSCISNNVSVDFFSAMQKRFDDPEQQQWRNDLETALGNNFAGI